jgi:hypothetical protein
VHDHYVARPVERGDFLRALAELEDRSARAEGVLARPRRRELVAALGPGETVERASETRPAPWRRELAAAHIKRVVVSPALRRGSTLCNAGRAAVAWREQ